MKHEMHERGMLKEGEVGGYDQETEEGNPTEHDGDAVILPGPCCCGSGRSDFLLHELD